MDIRSHWVGLPSVETGHLFAAVWLALEDLTTGLRLSVLGTNVWLVVGFGI
ncbi:hypothetical protein GCM10009067_39420 [Haloarcula sebkhae]|uniref:Uncharacterized protein n=1 Tax=Haloarcula sebkhae TaxID=932660 RepID=A0A830EX07_9EURY|nr:hypothetical protein GCM10009067_39420 [Haloarcula sebkhae]